MTPVPLPFTDPAGNPVPLGLPLPNGDNLRLRFASNGNATLSVSFMGADDGQSHAGTAGPMATSSEADGLAIPAGATKALVRATALDPGVVVFVVVSPT